MDSSTISHIEHDAHVFVHRFAHKPVHDVLSELVAVVAVDGVCQTDHHFKINKESPIIDPIHSL